MPCYEVRTMSVEVHAENAALLDQAARQLGANFIYSRAGTIAELRTPDGVIRLDLAAKTATLPQRAQEHLNALKRAYSAEAIRTAAIRNGWNVRQTKENQYTATRY